MRSNGHDVGRIRGRKRMRIENWVMHVDSAVGPGDHGRHSGQA